MFYRFARMFLKILFNMLFSVRVEGLEHLPQGRGYILACNHRTNCDPAFVAISLLPSLSFMAKAELFKIPVLGTIVRWLKAFPVERGTGDTSAVDFAITTVREGRVLAMFPEGTRSKDGKLGRAKSGCAVIAAYSDAEVVPVAVCYGKRLYPRCRVTVRYGAPIPQQELGVDPKIPSTIKAGSRLIMSQIGAMLEGGI